MQSVEVVLQQGDILRIPSDVLALKYAQHFYGVDYQAARMLALSEGAGPPEGSYRLYRNSNGPTEVFFMGVPPLHQLTYFSLRLLSERTLSALAAERPSATHVTMPVHGVGFGLDEAEAATSLLEGCISAVRSGSCPSELRRITIAELDAGRAQRLREVFCKLLGGTVLSTPQSHTWILQAPPGSPTKSIIPPMQEEKPHVFVAMPFRKDMDDVFYYGIKKPINDLGWLCERIDQEAFTGDILDHIKRRIASAVVIIADLTGANANVYLEVGYAWGLAKPTVLLTHSTDDLKFDVRGQRCLVYDRIRDLELALAKEIDGLRKADLLGHS